MSSTLSKKIKTKPQDFSKKNSKEMIKCACGCGKLMKKYDNRGRIRKYITGHHLKFTSTPFLKGNIPWSKNKKMSKEFCKKISKSLIGNKRHLGCLNTKKTKKKMSESHILLGLLVGKKNPNWKDGITPLYFQIRNCWKYKEWRSSVFERDYYTCQFCGDNKGHNLNAHHWKHFIKIIKENNITTIEQALACEELWNINNGITLCKECHIELHKKLKK